ncbi:molybdopterin-dependent oxidoreductase (plasmid) [Sphingobium sp. JS3065]|uniref:molybdopterin-dependent oxidoreductase n=1 Tax=Sphingobium sp. JS3065 TaxID=2970925 RepID=UPI0022649E2E|nr:molybdopterin-dependent oxidoreductase [Sphingobium sp. JS3065]UZW58301.1 molybdopterin-dependent oxidoreductase [Sphingobium sp. JS3065]
MEVGWEDALSDITARLIRVRDEHGTAAFATYKGNPTGYGFAGAMWMGGFHAALGVKWRYALYADDIAAKFVASGVLFGSEAVAVKPDLWRTHFALILGANPYVSHGSAFSEPRVRDALKSIVERGGRVVVVDPRRTETARAYEHVAVHPGSDAFLLIAMIRVILDEQLANRAFLDRYGKNVDRLAELLMDFSLEHCAERCRLEPDVIRALARDFARSPSAVVYGRTGTCLQRFATLVNILQDTVNALTGNIEREGGNVFGWSPIAFDEQLEHAGLARSGGNPTRVYKHPDVLGAHPSTSLVPDITTPGEERVRALMTFAGNPVMASAGGGDRLRDALEQLDLHFSLDLYVNETNRHAHYILPVTAFYEREDLPMGILPWMLRPALWYTPPVVPPPPGVREEWRVLQDIARRMGLGGAYASKWHRRLARLGIQLTPSHLYDFMLRKSQSGDLFGLRPGGLNLRKIKRNKDGLLLKSELPILPLEQRLRTADCRIDLASDTVAAELVRLKAHRDPGDLPFRLIGMREVKSQNSWLHNLERTMPPARTQYALINPEDAAEKSIGDGQQVEVRSKSGAITLPAKLTADVGRGTIVIPHGWGHQGGWKRANAAGGANVNILASGLREDVEPRAGMSVLTAIPIDIAAANPA